MNIFYLVFLIFASLLLANAVKAFWNAGRTKSRGNNVAVGVISLIASGAVVAVGHYMFNF